MEKSSGRVVVTDFGIAKVLGEHTSKLTRVGSLLGTPGYMAPEQCIGSKVDGRTDLYALGILIYEMLTGQPPFTTEDGPQALMYQHLQTPPPLLPALVPVQIRHLVEQLLAKDPNDRPADALAVKQSLEAAWAQGQQIAEQDTVLLEREREVPVEAVEDSKKTVGQAVEMKQELERRETEEQPETEWERRRKELFRGLSNPTYLEWQQEVLEILYDGLEIATVYGRRYPAAIIRPRSGWRYPFTDLCKLTEVKLPTLRISKEQETYIKMLGRSLRWPQMKGFALQRICLLISLQAMVVFHDLRLSSALTWRIVTAKRSDEVVAKPGFFQFHPAGGFEVYGTKDDDDDDHLVHQGFDLKTALFREYAEELFRVKDLIVKLDGRDPMSSVLSDSNVQELMARIDAKKAFIDYLGVVVDLAVLRHELSFLIVIDDENFCRNALLGSWEAKDIFGVRPRDLRSRLSRGVLHSSSAALLQLAMESERLRELGVATELIQA